MHPRHLVGGEEDAVLDLWRAWRGGAGSMGGLMASAGHLPFAGGAAEQPACLMAAFDICEAAFRTIAPKRGGG